MSYPVGILLAAGSGRRFDPSGIKNKLIEPLENGTPVAIQAAKNLLQVLSTVAVVTRSRALAAQFDALGCKSLLFADAAQGMGASLAHAVADVVESHIAAHAVLIALGDMPYLQTDTIEKLVRALQDGADMVQPIYQKQVGHPVGFSRRHFAALMRLQGERGARHLLREFPVTQVEVNDPGILKDIDYPADLRARES